jgi:ankyrin repeat protein
MITKEQEQLNNELIKSAKEDDLVNIKSLIEQGADINAYDYELGGNALTVAVEYASLETVKLLVEEYKADLDAYDNEALRLALAYSYDKEDIKEYLLLKTPYPYGVSDELNEEIFRTQVRDRIDAAGNCSAFARKLAWASGYYEYSVELLLEAGIDSDLINEDTVGLAMFCLIDNGADVDDDSNNYWQEYAPPIVGSDWYWCNETRIFDVTKTFSGEGYTHKHLIKAINNEDIDMFKHLYKKGAVVNDEVLKEAIKMDARGIVKFLIVDCKMKLDKEMKTYLIDNGYFNIMRSRSFSDKITASIPSINEVSDNITALRLRKHSINEVADWVVNKALYNSSSPLKPK